MIDDAGVAATVGDETEVDGAGEDAVGEDRAWEDVETAARAHGGEGIVLLRGVEGKDDEFPPGVVVTGVPCPEERCWWFIAMFSSSWSALSWIKSVMASLSEPKGSSWYGIPLSLMFPRW